MMSDLLYDKHDHYAVFTFNRPERLNALGGTLMAEVEDALTDFNADPKMRAGIVTGAGRAFCAGADLKEMAERAARGVSGHAMTQASGDGGRGLRWSSSPKPIIGAANGLAIGGGLESLLDMDVRICSSEAYFGLYEPKRGILAGYGIQHLPHVINMAAANYILLTADRISAEQALQWGIVSEIVPPERLLPRAIEIAGMIAANAPLSVEGTKASIQLWRQAGIPEASRLYEWIGRVVLSSADAKEGPTAFAEKRDAVWKGA